MNSSRMEAFSDGVLAIVITIQVLAMKVPHGDSLNDLVSIIPSFSSYITSFIYVGIYWNNHHYLIKNTKYINPKILWSNMHFLFWISLLPFTSDWVNSFKSSVYPIALYGLILLFTALSYLILQNIVINDDKSGKIRRYIGNDLKGKISLMSYIIAIVFAFFNPIISRILYFFVALIWFIPDKRILESFNNRNTD